MRYSALSTSHRYDGWQGGGWPQRYRRRDRAIILFRGRQKFGDEHLIGGGEAIGHFLKQVACAAKGMWLKDRPNATCWEAITRCA